MKRIIDVACGSKMFWFDKDNPDVEFCDIRTLERTEYYPGRYIEINPDTVCDFTNLPFEDNSFYLAVFDPPHLAWAGEKSIMKMKYGRLGGNWEAVLSAGARYNSRCPGYSRFSASRPCLGTGAGKGATGRTGCAS